MPSFFASKYKKQVMLWTITQRSIRKLVILIKDFWLFELFKDISFKNGAIMPYL